MISALVFCLTIANAGDRALYGQASQLIEDRYLRIDEVDPDIAFYQAAEAAEDAIPWLIAEQDGQAIVLRHGARGEFARLLEPSTTLKTLPDALSRLEDAILGLGEPLPESVDLPVELLRGVSRALDRPSVVLAGDRLERFDERIRGTTSGVGARIGLVDGELTVKSVFEGSPAERGGLRAGDVVLRIDGASTTGMPVSRAVDRIRGPEDTVVTLVVRRTEGGVALELPLSLQRAEMVLPNVTWERIEPGVGVIAIDHFSERTETLLRQGVAELVAQGPLTGVVLDLRGNAGGSMIQAARAADLFLREGLLVRTAGRGGAPVEGLLHEIHASASPDDLSVPLAVLVDEDAASASEILAGALQLNGRAVLLGQRTYGKGTVQKIFTLRGGQEPVRLKLTVAEYRLQGDVPVADVGLAPDAWTGSAMFGRNGVSLPDDPLPAESSVLFVEERPGWREAPAPEERPDALRALAVELVTGATDARRESMLSALEQVVARARAAEDARMVETFAARGLDWRAGEVEPPPADLAFSAGPPPVSARLHFEEAPVAGEPARLSAVVRSTSAAPLTRARLRLETDDGESPWDGVILPIGYLAPDAEVSVSAVVTVPITEASRQDEIKVLLEAEGEPVRALEPLMAEIVGRPAPELSASARLVPEGDHQVVELMLANVGVDALTSLRMRFAYPEQAGLELLDREATLPLLEGGRTQPVRLAVRLPETATGPVALDLLVEAQELPSELTLPLSLPLDGGEVVVSPPAIEAVAPGVVPPGAHILTVSARDDQGLADVGVWLGGEKIAWAISDGRELRLEVPMTVPVGTSVISARVHDSQGIQTERRWVVRGLDAGHASVAIP